MLTDSKVRQAGFIRNSSSRKMLHQPSEEVRDSLDSSDDSFSSFQYEGSSKISFESKGKIYNNPNSGVKSLEKKAVRPPSGHRPPRPQRKIEMRQPQFSNERLKNNFFQQNKQRNKQKDHPQISKPSNIQHVRCPTPQFQLGTIKQNIQYQQVRNICNRMSGMNLMQGNFSFNPKTNKMRKQKQLMEMDKPMKFFTQNDDELDVKKNRKPKQNNYFNDGGENHRFQYDFESSQSEGDQQGNYQSEKSEQIDDEVVRYYEQEKRRKELQAEFKKTVSKQSHLPLNVSYEERMQSQNKGNRQQRVPQKVYNQQSEDNNQELITQYNKGDFGMRLNEQMRIQAKKNVKALQESGVVQKQGGICFEVDTKQFSHGQGTSTNYRTGYKPYSEGKKKKVNDKEELLRRRQMAKIYSKQARFRLFGFA